MSILLQGKDMSNAYYGEQELSKVMLGELLVWENNKIIDLGVGQSFNIKTLYPNLYDKLTVNNFFFSAANNAVGYDSIRMRASDTEREWGGFSGGLSKSYNPETGILTAYSWCAGGKGNVRISMVLKPEKLVYLGEASGFSLKTHADWQKFTNDNFLISHSMRVATGNYFYPQGYDYSDSGTGTISFNKSYNAETGYLASSINLRSVDTSGVYTYYNQSSSNGLGIYLNPKVGA